MNNELADKAKYPEVVKSPYYQRAQTNKELKYAADKDLDYFTDAWRNRLEGIIGGDNGKQ